MSDLSSESRTPDESPADDGYHFDRPRPRRRVALIGVAVFCVVTAGVAVALVFGLRDVDASGVAAADGAEKLGTITLPAGCELLTPGQAGALVPGDEPTRAGRGPEVIIDATESACSWVNDEIDPTDPRVQPASIEVKAAAAADEDAAKDLMQISLPCMGRQSAKAAVFGAAEACMNHKAPVKGGPADIATVSARYQSLVVEVSYQRANWPLWRVEDQCEVTAAALISEIVQAQE
jgi:hypothetical protein